MQGSVVKTVTKNTFWLLTGNISTKLLSFALVLVLARVLKEADFGKFSFATSFVQIFAMLMDFGIGFLIIREVARDRAHTHRYLGNALSLRVIFSVLVFCLIAITLEVMNYPVQTKRLVYLFAVYFIFASLRTLSCNIYMAYEKMEFKVLVEFLERALVVVLCYILLTAKSSLFLVADIHLFMGLCVFILSLIILKFKFSIMVRFMMEIKFCLNLIKNAFPIAISNVLVALYAYMNIVILSKFGGDTVVGWYSAAFYLALSTQFITGAFLGAVFPVMSRLHRESDESFRKIYQKSFELMLAFGIPVSLAGCIFSDKIILFFYGAKYINSIFVLRVLISGTVFSSLSALFGHFLVATDRQDVAAKIMAVAVVLNLATALALVRKFGYVGVSFAVVFSGFAAFLVSLIYLVKKSYGFSWISPIVKITLSSLVMVILIYPVKNLNFLILLLLSIAVYIVLLFLTHFFDEEDKMLFKEMAGFAGRIKKN